MFHQVALTATAAATAASALAFGCMDAEPSLWIWDKFVTSAHLKKAFHQKKIWITGASSGIGEALAIQLDHYGAHLILSARNESELQRVAAQCGPHTQIIPLDVTNRQQVQDAIAQVFIHDHITNNTINTNNYNNNNNNNNNSNNHSLDCLILNAGIGQLQPAIDTDMDTVERLFEVNTLAPIHMAQAVMKYWTDTGHVILLSSVASQCAVPLSAAYAASKHAVHGYFQSLQSECPWLRIDLPCPGPTHTSFFGTLGKETDRKMPVERCARLILVSMIAQQGGERWIAQQPTLSFLFLNQFAPGLATMLVNKMGPTRLKLFEAGLNLYDPSSLSKLRVLEKDKRNR